MMKFALLALIAVVAGVAATSVEQQHDAAIAEVAAAMPEHAAAFAEVAAAAGTKDVFAVLDAISANIESERKHAQVFYRSYKKTTARDLRRYKLLIAKLSAGQRRGKQTTKAERAEIRQLRRAVNANVRTLSRAVARFQHVQAEERRTTHKKKAALRHINNKIADRKTYLKVLKAISAALRNTNQPVATRFVEALSAAHGAGMGAHADAPTVFLQLDAAEAVEESAGESNEAEAEVDAAIDHEAFEMENMPSENELELEVEDEDMSEAEEDAEDAAEDQAEDADEAELEAEEESAEEDAAESALDAAEESEEEESDEADSESDSAEEIEAEAEADSEAEESAESEGSDARMMQVLSALATGAQDDASVQELLQLVDALVADVRQGIAAAKQRRVAVLTKYAEQMKNLQALANSIKDSIRRLQVTVQAGRARLAELEGTATAVDANSKEANAQLVAYRSIAKGIRKNWAKYERRYRKNQQRRDKQLEQLSELKRRLAAIERERGTLGVDLSAVNLRYRWKAYPFGACAAACGPSTRSRKVKCLSFSGKPVKHSFCQGQKKPKVQVKCQKKACPIACVASEWKARGKCSNQCGTGVRLHTRSIIEPARFGGRCPQQFKLTKHKACKSLKGCAAGAAPTRQSRAEGKAAIAAARKQRQDRKIAAAQAAAARRAEALLGSNPNAAQAQAQSPARVLTPKQQAKRAKNKRCRECAKGKAGGPCRFQNCLNKAQKLACKACRKGKAGRTCRLRKCKQPAMNRRRALKKAAAKRRAAKKAAAAAAAAGVPQTQAPQQPLTALQKKIRSLKAKIAKRKAKCQRCRDLKAQGKVKKSKRCRRNRKCRKVQQWEAELAAARKARAEEKARLAAGKAPLTKLQKRIRKLKAKIAARKAHCAKCRKLKAAKKHKKAKRCSRNRKCAAVRRWEAELAAARKARAEEKARLAAGKAPLTALQKRIRSLKARIAALRAKCQRCRDLKKAGKAKKAQRCRRNRKCKRVAKRIAMLEKKLAAARAARAAEKAGQPAQAPVAAAAKKQQKAVKRSAKKYQKCRAKCRSGKAGRRCRTKCRNARLRRAADRQRREQKARAERRRRRAARRAEEKKRREALAKAKADAAAAAAAAAPATPATPAPASPAPADGASDMSPEVVIAKFRQTDF